MKMENLLGGIFPTDGMGIPARIPPPPLTHTAIQ